MSETPLKILYQDDYLVAIDKPAGHLVHPADDPQPDDLVAMKILRDQINKKIFTIHRLDRPTSGVLLLGIDKEASRLMNLAFAEHKVQKIYHAVIEGTPKFHSWLSEDPLQKSESHPMLPAKTSFKVLRSEQKLGIDLTLLECTLHTGRFHQIRKHLNLLGHPIFGDYRYNDINRCDELSNLFNTSQRMLLRAMKLEFTHPLKNEKILIRASQDPIFPIRI